MKRLRKFKPTKIAVEAAYGDAKINERYERFLAGNYTLTANEIDQIGYQLAKQLNHKQLYPADYKMGLDIDGVIKYAQANGQEAIIKQIENDLSLIDETKRRLQTRTLL